MRQCPRGLLKKQILQRRLMRSHGEQPSSLATNLSHDCVHRIRIWQYNEALLSLLKHPRGERVDERIALCLDLLTDDLDGVGMVLSYQFVDPPAGEETPFQHDHVPGETH